MQILLRFLRPHGKLMQSFRNLLITVRRHHLIPQSIETIGKVCEIQCILNDVIAKILEVERTIDRGDEEWVFFGDGD